MTERHLASADRHVASGAAIIARQREIIGELTEIGASTFLAESILRTYLDVQSSYEDDVVRLRIAMARLNANA